METYERIRLLRKDYLKLNQTEFGEKLGVSRTVIKNIELNVLARPDQKMSLYKLICSTFGISEDWLLNGTGEMYAKPTTFSLNDFVKSKGGSDLELEIMKAYFELDPEIRRAVLDHFKKHLMSDQPKKTHIEEEAAAYYAELKLEERQEPSPSDTPSAKEA